MNWKFVFNGHLRSGWNRNEAAKAAAEAGYQFMLWNSVVFYVANMTQTGLILGDLT